MNIKLSDGRVQLHAEVEPELGLINALDRYKADIAILCQASAALGVGLSWSVGQLCVDDDPADCGYRCMHHFLEQRLVQEDHRWRVGLELHEIGPLQVRSMDGTAPLNQESDGAA